MAIAAPILVRATLREEAVRGTKAHKVDRDQGIIYGVKVVGKKSPNTHGVEGAEEGTEYEENALQEALKRYDGVGVYFDHPPRDRPAKERSVRDRGGVILHPTIVDGEIYGDLKLFRSDPMSEKLFEAAEDPNLVRTFALSHNAVGKGEVRNGKYVVTEIPEVRSVDVVCEGGTNASLFEGREMAKPKKSLRRIIRENKAIKPRVRNQLLEAAKCMEDDELDKMEGSEEDGGYEGDAPGDHKEDLLAAIKKLCANDDEESHAMAKKIMGLLKPKSSMEESDEEDGEEEDMEESDEEEAGEGGADKATAGEKMGLKSNGPVKGEKQSRGDPVKKLGQYNDEEDDLGDENMDATAASNKMESREARGLKKELKQLKTTLAVKELCESLDFVPSKTQLEALLALPTDAKRKTLIQESRQSAKRASSAPRSSGYVSVQEGRVPKDPEVYAKTLLEVRKPM